jgi:hypothetical protein
MIWDWEAASTVCYGAAWLIILVSAGALIAI